MTRANEELLSPEQEKLVATSTVVRRLAPRVARRAAGYEEDELASLGYLSLRRAARNFDPTRLVPFDGYAYQFVHLDLLRHISGEKKRSIRERPTSFDSYGYLGRARDPGDIWNDTPADARRHVSDFVSGIFVVITAQLLSDASRAPSEDDIEAHLDWAKRKERLWSAVAELGPAGRVLQLRYLEELEWDQVAQALGESSATVRRQHDAAVKLLAARLRKKS